MDFQLSEQQRELQAAARKFARAEACSCRYVRRNRPSARSRNIKSVGRNGFGCQYSRSLGGLGLGNLEALLVLEEFAQISSASAFPLFEANVGPVHAIVHFVRSLAAKNCARGLSRQYGAGGIHVRTAGR